MKKIVLIALITLIKISAFSQLNGDFENWTTVGSYQNPDNWQTFNFLSAYGNPVSAFKASGPDKYSGNYALKIKTVFLTFNPVPNLPDSIGAVFNGKLMVSPPSYKIGSPYTSRPEYLSFYAKYIPVGSDTGGVLVALTKHNGVSRDTIATGQLDIFYNGSYSYYQLNLTYKSAASPDTAAILMASSKSKWSGRVGSVIFVDEVKFVGSVGINEQAASNKALVKVFPNPATDLINISIQDNEAEKIEVLDEAGNLVNTYTLTNFNSNINTSAYSSGFYFYKIIDKRKLILATGKFSLVK